MSSTSLRRQSSSPQLNNMLDNMERTRLSGSSPQGPLRNTLEKKNSSSRLSGRRASSSNRPAESVDDRLDGWSSQRSDDDVNAPAPEGRERGVSASREAMLGFAQRSSMKMTLSDADAAMEGAEGSSSRLSKRWSHHPGRVRNDLGEEGEEWIQSGVDAQLVVDAVSGAADEQDAIVSTAKALELEGGARIAEMRRRAAEAELERKHAEAVERRKAEDAARASGGDGGDGFGLSLGAIKPKGWRRVRLIHHDGVKAPLFDLLVNAKVAATAREDVSHVVTEVTKAELVSEIPRWLQGNLELNEMNNLKQRFALRRHPLVLRALNPWWQTAQKSMQAEGGEGLRLTRNEYIRIFTMVFKM